MHSLWINLYFNTDAVSILFQSNFTLWTVQNYLIRVTHESTTKIWWYARDLRALKENVIETYITTKSEELLTTQYMERTFF